MERILVVDDELSMREFLEIFLAKQGYLVDTASDGEQAIQKIEEGDYDLIICDLKMPRTDGLEVLRRAKEINSEAMFIMITAFASPESAVEAMKRGAYDYITKPFQVDEISLVVKKALEKARLIKENLRLQKEVESKYIFNNLVGSSPPMQSVFEIIRQVAGTRSNVLILGESGTGKELAAKAIHYNSPRRNKPFVAVNCGAIPHELLESELFGHLKGAFTGAYQDKRGLFEAAHQGTVFLDEIGEMPLPLQVKLLRVIQEKAIKPVGGIDDIKVDVRIIAASNADLETLVQQGRFREDLFYRLNVIQLRMPPLRERKEDIPLLIRHFIRKCAREVGKEISEITPEAEKALLDYDWPGNVRELENAIEWAVSLCRSSQITLEDLPEKLRTQKVPTGEIPGLSIPDSGIDLDRVMEDFERKLILEALRKSNHVKKKAAELLGISFRSLRYRLEKLGIENSQEENDKQE